MLDTVSERLKETVNSAIQNGYRCFITGGAVGFDTMAAQTVLNSKKEHRRKKIKLILAIPYPQQAEKWEKAEIEEKALADEVIYIKRKEKRLYARKKPLYD